MMTRFCFLMSIVFFSMRCSGGPLDSLILKLKSEQTDSVRYNLLKEIIGVSCNTDAGAALQYAGELLELSKKMKVNLGIAYFKTGCCYEAAGNYEKGLSNYFLALKNFEADKTADYANNIAQTNDYIAGIYLQLKSIDLAISYRSKAIGIYKNKNNKEGWAIAVFNLGNVYVNQGKYDIAISKIDSALKVFNEVKDESSIATANNTIGAIYFYKEDFINAKKYFYNAYLSRLRTNDNYQIVTSLINLGEIEEKLNRLDSALSYEERAQVIAEKMKFTDLLFTNYNNLSSIFEKKKEFEKANYFIKLAAAVRDSLFKAENQKQIRELSVQYHTEKKENENKILNLELNNEKNTKYILIVASFCSIIMAVFILRAYRIKRNSNKILEIKNIIIEEKSRLVELQHKDIKDSINYARRIQSAILPPDKMWFSILPDSFVLYKPKDILSGDFYWIEETPDVICFAAADCTGHGVPGALMSVVNFNLLNKAVLEQALRDPGKILDAVNDWLTQSLHQTYQESIVRDGMDISLCVIEKKTKKLKFAGANNPLYILNSGLFKEYKGDKFPVGAFIDEQKRTFTTKEIEIHPNDSLFIFSDGFADQFGGDKGKKFKYKRFQELLVSLESGSLQKQKKELSNVFEAWKGNYEQVDDVLIIGAKLYTV